ncbi:S-adenosyl-L-methionine-dependent methyltransferase [Phycomyces blakesleeanus]
MEFYKHAATILEKLGLHQGTIKGLVIGDPKVRDKKKMYALVCETLKYKQVLNEIIEASDILKLEKKLTPTLALVLIHDLLFTKRGIPVPITVPLKKCVQKHQARLKAELAKIKIKRKASTNADLVSQKVKDAVHIPRYARVNTHKTTMEKAIKAFEKEGYTYIDTPDDLRTLEPKTFCRDLHLNDLLVMSPKTDLHIHPLYVSGQIILQDKASCFPAHVCQATPGAHAIDACAAPGNKTSHLSALMKNTGQIWAFDLDSRRLDLLKRLTTKAGCKNITPVHGSFLETDPKDPKFANVEYLLLDPSCSGSGIISRLDHLVDDEDEQEDNEAAEQSREDRLTNLSEFQTSIIQHALKFPKAKRVVYSTCSIHAQENERVVKEVLESNPEFELASRDTVLPTWERRGIPEEMDGNTGRADAVVRTIPAEDLTNGFFVACFVRKSGEKRALEEAAIESAPKAKKNKNKNKNKKKNTPKKALEEVLEVTNLSETEE